MPPRSQRRFRARPTHDSAAYVHCVSRIVDRRFIFSDLEKTCFLNFVRRYEAFCCIRVVGYCLMSNHFHLLVKVTQRPDRRPSEAWLLQHTEDTLGTKIAQNYRDQLSVWKKQACRAFDSVGGLAINDSEHQAPQGTVVAAADSTVSDAARQAEAEAEYERVLQAIWQRMYDVSSFILSVKQQFTLWYNKIADRRGVLWEERFKSVLVQGGAAVAEMAAYIDLNPVRAGLVDDPKDYAWSQYGAAVAGEAVARKAVVYVAQFYASLTDAERAEWSSAQGRYRILMFRRGLLRLHRDGKVRGVFSRDEVEQVYAEHGHIPERPGVSFAAGRVRQFTEGVAFGNRVFVEGIFTENRTQFGARRTSGARRMRSEGNWQDLRSLRDLRPKN